MHSLTHTHSLSLSLSLLHSHLDALKFLRSEGCPWNKRHCRSEALRHGYLNIVRWIDEKGGDSESDTDGDESFCMLDDTQLTF